MTPHHIVYFLQNTVFVTSLFVRFNKIFSFKVMAQVNPFIMCICALWITKDKIDHGIHLYQIWCIINRDDSRLVPSRWETSVQSIAVSHWLGAILEPVLIYISVHIYIYIYIYIYILVHANILASFSPGLPLTLKVNINLQTKSLEMASDIHIQTIYHRISIVRYTMVKHVKLQQTFIIRQNIPVHW